MMIFLILNLGIVKVIVLSKIIKSMRAKSLRDLELF